MPARAISHNADGKVTSDNLQRAEKKKNNLVSEEEKNHYPQNGTNGIKDHYPPFGSNGNGSNGYGSNGNHTNANGSNRRLIQYCGQSRKIYSGNGMIAHIRQDGQVACEAKATGTD